MASGDAIFPEQAKIYIVDSDVAPSALDTSAKIVTAEVENFNQSGGEEDVDSRQVFGGGNIDLVKPRSQIEVSFDIILRYGAADEVLKWDGFIYGEDEISTNSRVVSSGTAPKKAIYIQWTDGTNYYTRAYRNAKGINFEPEVAADDLVTGTITFKLSPTNADGSKNFQAAALAANSIDWN